MLSLHAKQSNYSRINYNILNIENYLFNLLNIDHVAHSIVSDLVDSVCVDEFIDKSEKNIQRVNNRLNDYITNPSDENIHDIRIAIRRLEASYICLPKNIRKKKVMKDYVVLCKELFRINSEVRDCDVILERLLAEIKLTQENLFNYFQGLLHRQRELRLDEGMSIALRISKSSVPHLNKNGIIKKGLKNRYSTVVIKFSNRIEKNFPLVIVDNRKIRELHEMRKDCKKLRYLLELLPDKNSKNSKREEHVALLIANLEKVQDLLGMIHDYDMTIAYLRRHHKGTTGRRSLVQQVIERMINLRENEYNNFVNHFKLLNSHDSNNLLTELLTIN